jgi:large subunit ribosomal protein L33
MSQKHLVKIKSTATGHIRYTTRNKKSVEKKLEMKKHDPISRKHEIYKETKK